MESTAASRPSGMFGRDFKKLGVFFLGMEVAGKNTNLPGPVNPGEIPGNSGEIRPKAFHSFSFVFPGEKYISLLGKSNSPDFSSSYRENW